MIENSSDINSRVPKFAFQGGSVLGERALLLHKAETECVDSGDHDLELDWRNGEAKTLAARELVSS